MFGRGQGAVVGAALPLRALLAGAVILLGASCQPTEPLDLDDLGTIDLTINDHPFQLWVADERFEVQRGLMFITADQMKPLPDGTRRGMLFKFGREQRLAFWMANTYIPLDLVYLDGDGVVVDTYRLVPESRERIRSTAPAQYAIELNAGVVSKIGLKRGDKIEIPME